MLGKILGAVVVLLALGGGVGAGLVLRPAPDIEDAAEPAPPPPSLEAVAHFRDGFIVPVLRNGRVWSHVVLTLGVFSERLEGEIIIRREPILRDALTQALFQHGSLGGFDGDFTDQRAMVRLRTRLDTVLQDRLEDPSARVLIESFVRQGR